MGWPQPGGEVGEASLDVRVQSKLGGNITHHSIPAFTQAQSRNAYRESFVPPLSLDDVTLA